jgi:polysaccharide deacetylase family protein (PEP-CTERM system associated)
VDVEEWFHAPESPLNGNEPVWASLPSTLERGIDASLELLDRLRVKGTFFVLGWAARRFSPQVRAIAASGHEIACHGWGHRPLGTLDAGSFREELRRSRGAIEDAAGESPVGFRAPRWSMGRLTWPYGVLREEGFAYSSSRLPIPGLGCGRAAVREVHGVLEVPALSFPLGPVSLPAGGTAALRLLPVSLLRRARDGAIAGGRPAVYWFHPWELLPFAPRLEGGPLFRWVRYTALDRLPGRIEELVPPGDRRLGWAVREIVRARQGAGS